MKTSEFLSSIKNKYKSNSLKISNYCKNTYAYSLGECYRCGQCGRKFDEQGNLLELNEMEEADKDIFCPTKDE